MAIRELPLGSAPVARQCGHWTAEWYRAQLAGGDAARLCLDQIRRYFAADAVRAAA